MKQEEIPKKAQPPLVDRILQCGKPAFDPSLPDETRLPHQRAFAELVESTSTLALLPVLNLLVQPDRVHSWLRAPIIAALARLPLRPRGVQHTIEFVLSVHPTTAGANSQQNTGRGAAISHDALNAASRLLSSPPAGMSPDQWFQGIAPQLFSLLDGEGELEMDKAAAFIVGFGILGRRQYGAPGMPGWKAIVEPLIHGIDPPPRSLFSPAQNSKLESEIIDLSFRNVLVTAEDLKKSLRRLSALLSSHPNPALTKRLLKPVLLPLWALAYWPDAGEQIENNFSGPSKDLLKTFVQLSTTSVSKDAKQPPGTEILSIIMRNLLFRGRTGDDQTSWRYICRDGAIEIQRLNKSDLENCLAQDFNRIDEAIKSFIILLGSVPDLSTEISALFLGLFSKWIVKRSIDKKSSIATHLEPKIDQNDVQDTLIEAKIMQRMMSEFPDKLVHNSEQVLQICDQVLADFSSGSGDDEDTSTIALSLLNMVLTAQGFKPTTQIKSVLQSVENSLGYISRKTNLGISPTAQNILLLLRYRTTLEELETTTSSTSATDQQAEDRKIYRLAMSYLTATDSPPPVRAQGLELISTLILANSPILDIPALLVLFSSLLQDNEEYIYLRAVKSFIQLSRRHPKAVMKDLIDRYVDPNEEAELDQRLRLGEALLQVIQSNHLAFTNDLAKSICEGLLFVSSRRGHRPKTEREQEKKNKLKRKQDSEAEEAWDGPVPQLDEVLEIESKEDEDLMAQIVGGWESKRGAEDVRIRASALSIMGSAIEVNITGIVSSIISTAIDICIHILTLEPEPEKGILRRSAILCIMSFVRALDTARQEGSKVGFGFVGKSLDDILRILGYVEGSDNDGLVRQHARDVIEGLRTWQMNSLVPNREIRGMRIEEMAGLRIRPGGGEPPEGRVRPRIEEIE